MGDIANMLMPLQIERMFAGSLEKNSVFADESARLAYLTDPTVYAGQVVSQADDGSIHVVVKNALGDFEYVSVSGGDIKFDISTNYETMTTGAKPSTNKIFYVIENFTDGSDVSYEHGFWLYDKEQDKYIELSFTSDTKFVETSGVMNGVAGLATGTIVTGWSDHKVLQQMLFPPTSPEITSFTPVSTIYETGTSVGSVTLSVTAVKKTNPITSITFYADDVPIETVSSGVADGGTFTKDYDFSTNLDTNVVFKVVVSDGTLTDAVKTSTISFARSGFYGAVTDDTAITTSTQVRALTKKDNIKKGDTFTIEIPRGTKQVVISYPSTLGHVSSVKFRESLNMEVKTTFSESTVDVEGADGYTAEAYTVLSYIPSVEFSQVSHYDVTI